MKKVILGIVATLLLLASCASLFHFRVANEAIDLLPTQERIDNANIKVATNPRVVEGLAFVDGWVVEFGTAYGAQRVGFKVANDLAEAGWRDVWVLVELQSRGDPAAGFPAGLNSWMVSIFK